MISFMYDFFCVRFFFGFHYLLKHILSRHLRIFLYLTSLSRGLLSLDQAVGDQRLQSEYVQAFLQKKMTTVLGNAWSKDSKLPECLNPAKYTRSSNNFFSETISFSAR